MILYWVVWVVLRVAATVLFRLKLSGQHHIPKTGGVLIAANHASYLDIPILGCGVPRRASYMGRIDLFPGPVGWLMRHLGWIPIRRERVDRGGFEEAISRIKAGGAVIIYPEGSRTEDGRLQPGKPGGDGMSRHPRVSGGHIRRAAAGRQRDPAAADSADVRRADGLFGPPEGIGRREQKEGRVSTDQSGDHGPHRGAGGGRIPFNRVTARMQSTFNPVRQVMLWEE
jgi:1-acyl-sn-glycerol-3-phosphate acyltransferase